MLLRGINHVAILTSDTDRLHDFYRDVFEATVLADMNEAPEGPGVRLSIVDIGDGTMLNVFQIEGNAEALRQVPMFGRGRIDHLGLRFGLAINESRTDVRISDNLISLPI